MTIRTIIIIIDYYYYFIQHTFYITIMNVEVFNKFTVYYIKS